MLGLSLVVGWYLTLGLAEKEGLPKETMANNYVVTAIAAVAGARILYILTNLNEFDTLASLFAMRRGGLVAYGGFLGGLLGSWLFLRRHKIPLLPWADVAVPSLASGLMITRIGCYLFGCDFGQPLKDSAPAFLKKLGTFPHWDQAKEGIPGSPAFLQHVAERGLSKTAEASLPVHPTQLYESLVGLGLLGLLLWYRKRQKFRGEIFFLFAFSYGVCRYLLEILRDDAERGSIPPSLPEQILIPLGLVVLGVGWVIGFSKRIQNVTVQRITQVAAFLPAVLLYFKLQPDAGTFGNNVQYSTSQFIALASGIAASMAFAVFYKAALAHPKHAMDLGLPPEFAPAGATPPPAQAADEDDGEEEPVRRPPPKKKGKGKGKAKAKEAKKASTEAAESDAGETASKDDAEKSSEDEAPKGGSDEAKAKEKAEEDDGDPEPLKAS
jgi:phosphatidylglycerol:prolipoprotein diacylglycerol transferase